jgi:hypothetical protein
MRSSGSVTGCSSLRPNCSVLSPSIAPPRGCYQPAPPCDERPARACRRARWLAEQNRPHGERSSVHIVAIRARATSHNSLRNGSAETEILRRVLEQRRRRGRTISGFIAPAVPIRVLSENATVAHRTFTRTILLHHSFTNIASS